MADVEEALLSRWDRMHGDSGDVADADRQQWFSEAAAFLQPTQHWWCQHTTLVDHFAEIFVYHEEPIVQRLWSSMSSQLSTCALCVLQYHTAQASKLHRLQLFAALQSHDACIPYCKSSTCS